MTMSLFEAASKGDLAYIQELFSCPTNHNGEEQEEEAVAKPDINDRDSKAEQWTAKWTCGDARVPSGTTPCPGRC